MANDNKISVIIPVYNAEKYIGATIRSAMLQTYTDIEIIVVDNCSTDASMSIAKELSMEDKRIKIIKLDYNSGGPARPRNIGIKNSTGAFLAFLDADDIWEADKLQKQMEFLLSNKFDFVSSDYSFIDENGHNIAFSFTSKIKKILFTKNHTLAGTIFFSNIYTSSVLVKKADAVRFDEDKLLTAAEDWYLWLTLLNKGLKHGFLKEKLVRYRVTVNSTVGRANHRKIRVRQAYCLSKFMLSSDRYAYWGIFRLRQILSFR